MTVPVRTTAEGWPIHSRVTAAAFDVERGNDPTEWDRELDVHPREVWIAEDRCWARCLGRDEWIFVEGPPPSAAYLRARRDAEASG